MKCDIAFLTKCKKNKLIPTFARPKLAIKNSAQVKQKIAMTIIEAELLNKHKRLKYLRRNVKEKIRSLGEILGCITLCNLNRTINKRLDGMEKGWKEVHERKLHQLYKEKTPTQANTYRPSNIVHNFSSYELTAEEHQILSFGLDHHIPTQIQENAVKTEFEAFFYHLNKNLKHLNADEKDKLKTKMRRTCENYYNVKNKEKVDEVIRRLMKNRDVAIVKQDKGRGVVLLDKSKYVEKCMEHLNSANFKKLDRDNTKSVEEAIQKTLLKMKSTIGEDEYQRIYPSGSNPGKFYGTAKVHKVKAEDEDKLGKLPIRPIVSNIGTATHKTAQYLCRLLTPLGKSKYTVQNTKEFVEKIKGLKVPEGYQMVSFDVVSLFTNVPLDKTIEIILRKVYDEKKIVTKIKREELKRLLILCTKGVAFSFNGDLYIQVEGVMMGSPLGALFANIFMAELENKIVPRLQDLSSWNRYVDDTFAFVKQGKEKAIQEELNKYHPSIKFTYEVEEANKISFLDVLITKENGSLQTSVYRKATNTDVYMNWKSHAPKSWKVATLKSLVKRAFMISSTEASLDKELVHLKKIFAAVNQYPEKLIERIINNEKEIYRSNSDNEQDNQDNDHGKEEEEAKEETITLNLPYAGTQGENIMSKFKKDISNSLGKNGNSIKIRVVYRAKRLSSKFTVKDKIDLKHLHNVVYHTKCPNKKCKSEYVGQTKCRVGKRTIEHNRTDKKSHVLKHSKRTKHRRIWLNNVKILGQGYQSDFKRKISESLFIRTLKPDLNVQKDAYKLSLFQ